MYLFKKNIIIILLFLCSLPGFAQEYLFDVQTINVEDGLAERDIHGIAQDSKGYIWLSMQGVLSRFDGHQFKNYDYDFLNIRPNSTITIAVDKQDRIWYSEGIIPDLTTFSGILDTKQDTVYTFESISNGLIQSDNVNFVNTSDFNKNIILIGTKDGSVYKYNGKFTLIYKATSYKVVWNCFEFSPNIHYVFQPPKIIKKVIERQVVETVMCDTSVANLFKIDDEILIRTAKDHRQTRYLSDISRPIQVSNTENLKVKDIIYKQDSLILCNTNEGLIIQDDKGKILWKYEEKSRKVDFKYNQVFKDAQNILWITSNDGILKIQIKKNPFTILQKNNSIRGITQIDNQLYIGGYSGSFYKNKNGWLKFLPEYSAMVSCQKDKNGTIWVGTTECFLYRKKKNTSNFESITIRNIGEILFSFINPVTNHFLLGTSEGVYRYDPKKSIITPLLSQTNGAAIAVRSFHTNSEGIWITTTKGLFLLDKTTEKTIACYSKKDGFPTDNFNHLHEDENGIFWLGTKNKGLIRWDRQKNEIRQFSKKDGLSNNNIYAVYSDDFGGLWLPSDYGLMRFNKASKEVKVYMPNDGIAHEEFNTFAHFKDNDGYLYFGGLNGITKFHPKDFIINKGFQPNLVINSIKVLSNNSESYQDKTDEFLTKNKITLKSHDKVLELQMALLDFSNPSENKYAYKILNHSNQWFFLNDNTLSINNLTSGNYTLVVKARGSGGNWLKEELNIKLYIAPPFYSTWWFISMTVILIALGTWSYFRYRTIQLQLLNIELEKTVKERTQKIKKQADELKALDKAKSIFFSNLTHEFRTPLTLIIGPLQQLLKQTTETSKQQKINGAINNANQLLSLVNQLLDISKLESNQMQLEVCFGNIVTFTEDIIQRFQPLAIQQQKQLSLNITTATNETCFDKEKWNKILSNLLSNALKYTNKNDKIEVHLVVDEQRKILQLSVKDNGNGIEKSALPLIFKRFYQTNMNRDGQLGTGIGLALVKELVEVQQGTIEAKSKVGVGSIFIVNLPILEATVKHEETTSSDNIVIPMPVTIQHNLQKPQPSNNHRISLLIIDDNPEMRQYIRDCIDESVYEITEAKNGEEGIKKAFEIIPDLIISDVMMPQRDGYEVTQMIRQTVSTSHIPLILLTAKTSLESRLKGLQRGADVYLTKPFSAEELILRIEKLLEIRRLIQQQLIGQIPNQKLKNIDPICKIENQFIIDVRNYILENIEDDNLTVESVGQAFSLGRMQFYRKIKALTDQSASEFIRSVRLTKAVELIKTKELTLSEIAYTTGFSSLSSFSKAFKKQFGQSPSSFTEE